MRVFAFLLFSMLLTGAISAGTEMSVRPAPGKTETSEDTEKAGKEKTADAAPTAECLPDGREQVAVPAGVNTFEDIFAAAAIALFAPPAPPAPQTEVVWTEVSVPREKTP